MGEQRLWLRFCHWRRVSLLPLSAIQSSAHGLTFKKVTYIIFSGSPPLVMSRPCWCVRHCCNQPFLDEGRCAERTNALAPRSLRPQFAGGRGLRFRRETGASLPAAAEIF